MKKRKLLTAPQVARLCGADLKTIHNWVNAGRIDHFRTPGRHLRFRAEDVAAFMESFGYPVPPDLASPEKELVVLLDPNRDSRSRARRSLARNYEVKAFACPVEALLTVGRERPVALALDVDLPALDGFHLLERLKKTGVTDEMSVVVYGSKKVEASKRKSGRWNEAGGLAFVRKPDVSSLRKTIDELLTARSESPARTGANR
jgi:excisionase family DNA binding protein